MCGCGSSSEFLGAENDDGVCDYVCPGAYAEYCGGDTSYSLYEFKGEEEEESEFVFGITSAASQLGLGFCRGPPLFQFFLFYVFPSS